MSVTEDDFTLIGYPLVDTYTYSSPSDVKCAFPGICKFENISGLRNIDFNLHFYTKDASGNEYGVLATLSWDYDNGFKLLDLKSNMSKNQLIIISDKDSYFDTTLNKSLIIPFYVVCALKDDTWSTHRWLYNDGTQINDTTFYSNAKVYVEISETLGGVYIPNESPSYTLKPLKDFIVLDLSKSVDDWNIDYIPHRNSDRSIKYIKMSNGDVVDVSGTEAGSKINDYIVSTDSTWSSSKINSELSGKQDTLVSGVNIKTVNNESLLGNGNISIGGALLRGTTAYWDNQPDLMAEEGKIYEYIDCYTDADGNFYSGFKIGDGMSYLSSLPFANDRYEKHLDNTIIHITSSDREYWNNKVDCYMKSEDENLIFTRER